MSTGRMRPSVVRTLKERTSSRGRKARSLRSSLAREGQRREASLECSSVDSIRPSCMYTACNSNAPKRAEVKERSALRCCTLASSCHLRRSERCGALSHTHPLGRSSHASLESGTTTTSPPSSPSVASSASRIIFVYCSYLVSSCRVVIWASWNLASFLAFRSYASRSATLIPRVSSAISLALFFLGGARGAPGRSSRLVYSLRWQRTSATTTTYPSRILFSHRGHSCCFFSCRTRHADHHASWASSIASCSTRRASASRSDRPAGAAEPNDMADDVPKPSFDLELVKERAESVDTPSDVRALAGRTDTDEASIERVEAEEGRAEAGREQLAELRVGGLGASAGGGGGALRIETTIEPTAPSGRSRGSCASTSSASMATRSTAAIASVCASAMPLCWRRRNSQSGESARRCMKCSSRATIVCSSATLVAPSGRWSVARRRPRQSTSMLSVHLAGRERRSR
mmetsp:Transcript_9522/g.26332  ORF Transcript_9522/g.26332 Transcript_9522/m.26332 type:complete len:460 (+) Transcript_9522:1650-3029(+)|eukprot:scaffold226467_cov31-Tisochrysis_lutea.AAC.3